MPGQPPLIEPYVRFPEYGSPAVFTWSLSPAGGSGGPIPERWNTRSLEYQAWLWAYPIRVRACCQTRDCEAALAADSSLEYLFARWSLPSRSTGESMKDRDIAAELREAERRIAEHPAAIEHAQYSSLEWSLMAVFRPNAHELIILLDAASTNTELAVELIQNMRPPVVRLQFQRAVAQRLHNYLAAAASLVDHVRRLMNERTDEVAIEFAHRKAAVTNKPSIRFMQDLRNYTLHRALPLIGHSLQEHPDGRLESEVQLDAAALAAWNGWSSRSQAYLQSNSDAIDLRRLCREHMKLLWGLNAWLHNALALANGSRLSEVNQLIVQRNAILTGGDIRLAERITVDSTARNTLLPDFT